MGCSANVKKVQTKLQRAARKLKKWLHILKKIKVRRPNNSEALNQSNFFGRNRVMNLILFYATNKNIYSISPARHVPRVEVSTKRLRPQPGIYLCFKKKVIRTILVNVHQKSAHRRCPTKYFSTKNLDYKTGLKIGTIASYLACRKITTSTKRISSKVSVSPKLKTISRCVSLNLKEDEVI